jgi:hypothetical protein
MTAKVSTRDEKTRVRRPTTTGDREVPQRSRKASGQPVGKTTKSSEEARQEVPQEANEYGVDLHTFVTAWESSENPDEVYQKLEDVAKVANRQPMPKPIIIARAAKYRKAGIKLKKFKTGRPMPKADVFEANRLIDQIRTLKGEVPLPPPAATLAATPAIPEEYVREAMRRLLATGMFRQGG